MSNFEPAPAPNLNLEVDGGIRATLAQRLPAVEPVLCRLIAAIDADDVDEYAGTSTTLQWQTELVLMLGALIPTSLSFAQLSARWTEAAA